MNAMIKTHLFAMFKLLFVTLNAVRFSLLYLCSNFLDIAFILRIVAIVDQPFLIFCFVIFVALFCIDEPLPCSIEHN